MRTRFWTKGRVEVLRSMWSTFRTREIADALGCTGNAVIGKANRLGLPPIDRTEATHRAWLTRGERRASYPTRINQWQRT